MQRFRHATDGNALTELLKDVLDFVDIGLAVQAVALLSALRLNKSVAALPGAQSDGIDSGDFGHGTDGVEAAAGLLFCHIQIRFKTVQNLYIM